jgi:hypothetical protein
MFFGYQRSSKLIGDAEDDVAGLEEEKSGQQTVEDGLELFAS